MIMVSAEYRYPIWKNWDEYGIDFVLFGDAGQVTPDLLNDAGMDMFHTGYGFGMRIWDQGGLIAKLEAGNSDDGWRFYFVLN